MHKKVEIEAKSVQFIIKIGAFLDTFTICSKIQAIAPIFGENSKKLKYLIFLGAGLHIIFMF